MSESPEAQKPHEVDGRLDSFLRRFEGRRGRFWEEGGSFPAGREISG